MEEQPYWFSNVSIHAPVRRRRWQWQYMAAYFCFNPRPRKEATTLTAGLTAQFTVSIHAPVRRRLIVADRMERQMGFNPRPRKEATWVQHLDNSALLFQSTPP